LNARLSRYVGLALLVVVAVVLIVLRLPPIRNRNGNGNTGGSPAPNQITVRGIIGSEKAGLLDDPEIKQILHDKYGLTVDYKKAGSLQIAQGKATDQNFLWPGGQYPKELYERDHGQVPKSEVTFSSPIVMYAWAPVTQALLGAGIVEQTEGISYVDLAKLLQVINDGKSWRDIGLPQVGGKVLVYTTDPTKSNSGNLFAGLLANTLNGGTVVDDSAVGAILPGVQSFYARLGYTTDSSGFLFDQFLAQGIGAYPIIVGYENQLIEYSIEHPEFRDVLLKQITILYPRPTAWATHTLLALDAPGARLLDALKDPSIQKLAWERHGFRTGLIGVQNDPAILQVVGVPRTTVQTAQPIPRASVMDRIVQALGGP
jgi:hypothetical protein